MVTKDNCYTMPRHNLLLAGDVAYGANKQFEPEARTALRLSHFLSNFLQVSSSLRSGVSGASSKRQDPEVHAPVFQGIAPAMYVLTSSDFARWKKIQRPKRSPQTNCGVRTLGQMFAFDYMDNIYICKEES